MAEEDEADWSGPLTALQVSALQQHEMYASWVEAGFTDHQALELLKSFIMAMVLK
jgi:hypothetical protein